LANGSVKKGAKFSKKNCVSFRSKYLLFRSLAPSISLCMLPRPEISCLVSTLASPEQETSSRTRGCRLNSRHAYLIGRCTTPTNFVDRGAALPAPLHYSKCSTVSTTYLLRLNRASHGSLSLFSERYFGKCGLCVNGQRVNEVLG